MAWVLTTLSHGGRRAVAGDERTCRRPPRPQWLTRPSLFLHGVAAAYWIGALAPLATMAHRRNDDLPRVLKQVFAHRGAAGRASC